MNIHLFLIPFIIILGLFFSNNKNNGRKSYIIIVCLVLMLIIALRSTNIGYQQGSDVGNYAKAFDDIKSYSWQELWNLMLSGIGTSNDRGFFLLQKAIRCITSNFHIYSFLASSIFFVPFGIFLFLYSTNTKQLIFAFVFVTVMYFPHLMSGARQVYAVGFVWIAFTFFLRKKYLYTLFCIILASIIHFSSILILLPILMSTFITHNKIIKIIHLVTLFLVPVVMFQANSIIIFMGNSIGSDKYAEYGKNGLMGGTGIFITIITLLSLFCFIAIKEKDIDNNEFLRKLYVMAPCFTFFAPLIYSNGSMIRISEYFYLFLALLFPFAIEHFFDKKSANTLYIITISILSIWTIVGNSNNYYFYWQ